MGGIFHRNRGVTGLVTAFIVGRRQLASQQEAEFSRKMQAAKMIQEKQKAEQELQGPSHSGQRD